MFKLVLSCLILVAVCFFIFFVILIIIIIGSFSNSEHSFTEDDSSKISSMSTSVTIKDDASVTHTAATTTESTYNVSDQVDVRNNI